MAIVWMDGFNTVYGNVTIFNTVYSSNALNGSYTSATSGRYDGYGINVTDYTANETNRQRYGIHKSISPTNQISVGVAFFRSAQYWYGVGPLYTFLTLYNGDTATYDVTNDFLAKIGLYSTTSSGPHYLTVIDRSGSAIFTSQALNINTTAEWHYFELELTTGTSSGTANLYLDGVLVGAVSSANFSTSSAQTSITSVGLLPLAVSTSYSVTYDDFYICDTASRLGELHISTVRPTADTAQKDWTPSSSTNNYGRINALSYSNTAYVTASGAGKSDLYDMADLSTVTSLDTSDILAIKVNSSGYKLQFGPSNINSYIKTGSLETDGPVVAQYEGAGSVKILPPSLYENNPSTSAKWTTSDINSLQTGIRSS